MFVEELLVFCEMELIVPLDITIFDSFFFVLIHLFVFILSNLVGFALLLIMKFVF